MPRFEIKIALVSFLFHDRRISGRKFSFLHGFSQLVAVLGVVIIFPVHNTFFRGRSCDARAEDYYKAEEGRNFRLEKHIENITEIAAMLYQAKDEFGVGKSLPAGFEAFILTKPRVAPPFGGDPV
jgi:hypothetical protein